MEQRYKRHLQIFLYMRRIIFSFHPLLLFSCFSLWSFYAGAQTFFAQRQSQVDSFPILAGNADLYGTIIIYGSDTTANAIHDLTPLLQLKVLTGGLAIVHTTRLKSLHGLDSLIYIGGLSINNNDSLRDLSGLNPKYIYSDLVIIEQNKGLEEINGLNGHAEMHDFRIDENPRLKVINGLESLRDCPYIDIKHNDLLEHILIPNLQVSNSLFLWRNPNLQAFSFPKLDSIRYYSGSVWSYYCPRLKSLDGFEPKYMQDEMRIRLFNNDSLRNMDAVGRWPAKTMSIEVANCHHLDSVHLPNVKKTIRQLYRSNTALRSIRLPNVDTAQYGDQGNTAVSIARNPNLVEVSMPKLKTITYIEDSLSITFCPKLASLEGFGSLENVHGRIVLKGLPSLKTLHGLEKLRFCGDGFEVGWFYGGGRMDSLESLCQFEQFEYARFDFQLMNCPRLSSLSGLETFRRTSFLHLAWLDSLKSLEGLNNLDSLRSDTLYYSGRLSIDSTGLEDMSAVKNVAFGPETYILIQNSHRLKKAELLKLTQGIAVFVRNCAILDDIQFPALYKFYNLNYPVSLWLDKLPALSTLDGLKNLKIFHTNSLNAPASKIRIKNDPLLTDCDAICRMRETIAASFFDIQNNAFPCNTLPEIEEHVCDSLSYVFDPANTLASGLRVAPNPAQDVIALHWLAYSEHTLRDCLVTLVSSTGQALFTQKINGPDSRVDVSQVPSGFYFLQISAGGRRLGSQKVVVSH